MAVATGPGYGRAEAKEYAREKFRGIFTAFVLPETPDHEVDEDGLRRDVRHYIDVIGSGGLYPNAFYGNGWLMTVEERNRVIEVVVEEAAGQIPVLARCQHQSLRDVIRMAQHAEAVGADFVSVVGPFLGGNSEYMVLKWFEEIAASINIGVSVFNTHQVGYTISPELMARLAEIPNVVALKSAVDVGHTIRTRQLAGDGIVVIDPTEPNMLLSMLQFGQKAIFTGTNMMYDHADATPMRDYVAAGIEGDALAATELFYRMQPLRDLHQRWIADPWKAQGVCPVARIKYWCELNGLHGGTARPPLEPFSEEGKAALRTELEKLGALPRAATALSPA